MEGRRLDGHDAGRRRRQRRRARRRSPGVRGAGRRRRSRSTSRPTVATSTIAVARTHPRRRCARRCSRAGADVGLAFDGDADRVFAVDATGGIVDGDQIMAMCALDLQRARPPDRRHARRHGDEQPRAAARDARRRHRASWRHRSATATCSRRSTTGGLSLGGEQSGHVIFHDLAPRVTACSPACRSSTHAALGTTARRAGGVSMTPLPQVLRQRAGAGGRRDRRGARGRRGRGRPRAALAGRGRVLIRPSGTEPLVRVMVEAPTAGRGRAVGRPPGRGRGERRRPP